MGKGSTGDITTTIYGLASLEKQELEKQMKCPVKMYYWNQHTFFPLGALKLCYDAWKLVFWWRFLEGHISSLWYVECRLLSSRWVVQGLWCYLHTSWMTLNPLNQKTNITLTAPAEIEFYLLFPYLHLISTGSWNWQRGWISNYSHHIVKWPPPTGNTTQHKNSPQIVYPAGHKTVRVSLSGTEQGLLH